MDFLQALTNLLRPRRAAFESNNYVEMRARQILRSKGWYLPSQSYDLERTRYWNNNALSIADYRPDGRPNGVLLIHALVDGKPTLVYLSGDQYNAYYQPGRWEAQLNFFALQD